MNFEKSTVQHGRAADPPWEVLDFDVLDLLMSVRREEFVPEAYSRWPSEAEILLGHGASMLIPVIEGQDPAGHPGQALRQGARGGRRLRLTSRPCSPPAPTGCAPSRSSPPSSRWPMKPQALRRRERHRRRRRCHPRLAEQRPYDLIVVSGGVPFIPETLLQQLKVGGRLFAFVGEPQLMTATLVTQVSEATSAPNPCSRTRFR